MFYKSLTFSAQFLGISFGISLGISLGLGSSAQATDLYLNFSGYHTPQRQLNTFSAMAIDQGKVLAIGTPAQLMSKYPDARQIDLAGKTLLPGLIDGHGHVTSLGQTLQRVKLRGITSEKSTVQKVAQFAKANPNLSWITGHGWNQVLWPDNSYPTKGSLDQLINDRPIWLRRIDGHAGWANSKALALAGITKNTEIPAGGDIIKDAAGEPTGILVDNAMALIDQKIPALTLAQTKQAIILAAKHLQSVGITSAHDAGLSYQSYQAMIELSNEQQLPIRIYGMLDVTDPNYLTMLAQGKIYTNDDKLHIASVKISADGALGSRGAAMLSPYSDDKSNSGLMLLDENSLTAHFKTALSHDFQINIHAIGDRANHVALNLFEKYNQLATSRALRHRIEHAQVVKVSDLPRFKTLGVLPSMQPTHATSDMNMAQDRVGHSRLKGAYAWRTLLNDGVRIISGSDFPIEYANPFFGLHSAVTRQDHNNQPPQGWLHQEAMTLEQALNSFTLDAAFGAHQENIIGTLEPGKWADFVVIEQDIFTNKPEQIWQAKVLGTWIAGQQVFSSLAEPSVVVTTPNP